MTGVTQAILMAGGGAVWTPADMTSSELRLWYNDDSSLTTETGDRVTQWNDIAANGDDHLTASSGGSLRPTMIASALNGRRIIRFNGTSQYLINGTGGNAAFTSQGAGWVFAVIKKAALDAGNTQRPYFFIATGTSTVSRFQALLGSSSNGNEPRLIVRRLDADAAGQLALGSDTDTSWHMILMEMDWTNGDGFIYVDDPATPVASSTTLTSNGSTSNTSSGSLYVGGSVAPSYADVDIAEIVVGRNTLLSTLERTKLFDYAASRWGL